MRPAGPHPDGKTAHYMLGLLWIKTVEIYEKALTLGPEDP